MRRLVLVAALVGVTALSGCGSQTDAYCDTVKSQQSSLSKQLDDGGGSTGMLQALPTFKRLKSRAPADVEPQWQILVTALSGLQRALDDAHVDAATYRRGTTKVSKTQQDRIDAAAAQLGTERVVDALQAVAQETRDVCHTPLTLGWLGRLG